MKKQQGMTVIGMLMTVAVIVISLVVVIRIVPVYIQYYTITSAIKSLNAVPASSLSGDPSMDVSVLRNSLTKRFDMNSVDEVKPEQVKIAPKGQNKFEVKLKYQVIRFLVYNVSLLFDFNDVIEVKAGSES